VSSEEKQDIRQREAVLSQVAKPHEDKPWRRQPNHSRSVWKRKGDNM